MNDNAREIFVKQFKKWLSLTGKTQADVARGLNIPKTTVANWYHGVRYPRPDAMQRLADFFGIRMEELISDNFDPATYMGENYMLGKTFDNIYPIDVQKIPMLGTIACGEPIYADEDRESYVLCGTEIKADFCLRCKGDSMVNARIYDNDIVFIRKQDIVSNGEIAAVIIDDEVTLKRFYYYRDQNLVILKPENSKYEDIVLTGEKLNQVKVLGKAVAFQSDVI